MHHVGTVIEGTLRPEDLIPAFMEELALRHPTRHLELLNRYSDVLDMVNVVRECDADIFALVGATTLYSLAEDICMALDDVAPEGTYFGAHPGDGSDFGFWPIEEEA